MQVRDTVWKFNRPRVPLMTMPTPVKRLDVIGKRVGCDNLWMKIDGLSNALYGGSKLRNLEFLIGEAKSRHATKVVTFGTLQSNFARSLIECARAHALDVELFLANLTRANDDAIANHLRVLSSKGAKVRLVSRIELAARNFGVRHFGLHSYSNKGLLSIPVGGACPVGCLGALNAAFELSEQVRRNALPMPATIYLPLGSGGLAAGLYAGFSLLGFSIRLVCVRVGGGPSSLAIKRLARKTLQLVTGRPYNMGVDRSAMPKLEIRNGFCLGGYGIERKELNSVKELIFELEGVRLDTFYTAKAMIAMLDSIDRKQIDVPILFWNTCSQLDES